MSTSKVIWNLNAHGILFVTLFCGLVFVTNAFVQTSLKWSSADLRFSFSPPESANFNVSLTIFQTLTLILLLMALVFKHKLYCVFSAIISVVSLLAATLNVIMDDDFPSPIAFLSLFLVIPACIIVIVTAVFTHSSLRNMQRCAYNKPTNVINVQPGNIINVQPINAVHRVVPSAPEMSIDGWSDSTNEPIERYEPANYSRPVAGLYWMNAFHVMPDNPPAYIDVETPPPNYETAVEQDRKKP